MNFMVVILNRGLDSNNQLLSDDSTEEKKEEGLSGR